MNAPDDAMFIEGHTSKTREFAREQQSLIETAFTFAFRVQRDRNDQVGAIERFGLLRGEQQTRQPSGDGRLTLQLQDRNPQGSFIESASPRAIEGLIVALATPDTLSSIFANRSLSKSPALPAQRIIWFEDVRRLPARGARDTVVTRLDARAANGAGLRIDERQRCVV